MAYDQAMALGVRELSVSLDWSELEPTVGNYDDTLPAIIDAFYPPQTGDITLVLRPLDTPGPRLPADLAGLRFDDRAVITAFEHFLTHLHDQLATLNASGRLKWIHVANEIAASLGNDAARWSGWETFFNAPQPVGGAVAPPPGRSGLAGEPAHPGADPGHEKRAVAIKDTPPEVPAFADLDEIRPGLELVMSRHLFTPPSNPAIDDRPLTEADVDIQVDARYRQTWIDEAELKASVGKALQTRSQITLGELSERFPMRKGHWPRSSTTSISPAGGTRP